MGREATGFIDYGGRRGDGRALLEAGELILRGEVKARLARSSLTNPRIEGDALVLDAPDGRLAIDVGAVEAGRWIEALSRAAPTLAEKLGIQAGGPVWVWGQTDDSALNGALAESRPAQPGAAALHLAIVSTKDDLASALAQRGDADAALWLVYPKGRREFGDAAIRATMRETGYIDSKSCAVSAALTATRYGRRKT